MNLYLVRHADSTFVASSDHQRPLTELGMQQAAQSANYLKQKVHAPDTLIICSDALRTETTASIIQQHIESNQLISESTYYHARTGEWCDGICSHRHVEHLILVGHNPTMSFLSKHLNPSAPQQFKQSCVAHYELEILTDGLKLPAHFIDFFTPDAV